jgi:UDP-4-amino-4,6-dideoxy-N-acetyl-beta-L-altrosamine transaminase
MIPYGRQEITDDDIAEVEKVLRSDYLTQGPLVPRFEQSVSKYCNVNYGVAVNSATSALHIACLALGLGPEDMLWTSPNTFVASANCGRYCGADIDFVDIDPKTYNMSVSALSEKLIKAKKIGKLPKIVVPVHFAGQPCDMAAIHDLSKIYGFKIIEDASHSIGASYTKFKVGSCAHSDVTVFSFHPVKIITTAEGGMALTNDKKLSESIRRLSTHGITKDELLMSKRSANEIWNYQQIQLGFNYRMNDIQAALGISQLKRLDSYVSRRHEIASYYDLKLANLPITSPWQLPNTYSSYHLYPICIQDDNNTKLQKKIYHKLHENGIAANLHYIPVHRQPYYESLGFKNGDFLESEKFHRKVISLPIFPSLKKSECEKVISVISKVFQKSAC